MNNIREKAPNKTEVFRFRLTKSEKENLMKSAELLGIEASELVRDLVNGAMTHRVYDSEVVSALREIISLLRRDGANLNQALKLLYIYPDEKIYIENLIQAVRRCEKTCADFLLEGR